MIQRFTLKAANRSPVVTMVIALCFATITMPVAAFGQSSSPTASSSVSPASTSPPSSSVKLPPPKSPVIRRAPGNASWAIHFTYPASPTAETAPSPVPTPAPAKGKAAGSDRLQTLTVTKTGKTYWEQSLWTSGKKSEKWIIEGIQMQIPPGGTEVALVPRPEVEDPESPWFDYTSTDFPEFKGISLQSYKAEQSYQGRPAYQFEWEKGGEKRTALLTEDQLPLTLTTPHGTQIYTFSATPPAKLVPPEKFLKTIATHRRGLQALRRNPSPP